MFLFEFLFSNGVRVLRELRQPGRQDLQCNFTLDVSSFRDGDLSPSPFTYPLVAFERCNQAQFLFCSGPGRRQKIAVFSVRISVISQPPSTQQPAAYAAETFALARRNRPVDAAGGTEPPQKVYRTCIARSFPV